MKKQWMKILGSVLVGTIAVFASVRSPRPRYVVHPCAYTPCAPPVLDGTHAGVACVSDQLAHHPAEYTAHVIGVLHLLRLEDRLQPAGVATTSLFQALTQPALAAAKFGSPLFYPSPFGIRCRSMLDTSTVEGESHRDQCLATFAECGVPLDTPVSDGTTIRSVRDLLLDSVATFRLDQREIGWTSLAYATYIRGSWRNSDGDSFTMDQLVKELLSRPLDREPCSGVHTLHALLLLRRLGEAGPVLRPATASLADAFLQEAIANLAKHQCPDGHWGTAWPTGGIPPAWQDTTEQRLLVTGHVLEFSAFLPEDLALPSEARTAAAAWIVRSLRGGDLVLHVCTWSHAVNGLRLACPSPFATSGTPVAARDANTTSGDH
jgi:hypothetical protein